MYTENKFRKTTMNKQNRKSIKANAKQYEILRDYADSKGISMGEALEEMQKDIELLKAHELNTVSENAKMFCDQVEALAECGRLPLWLSDAIKATIRPVILKGMVGNQPIDFEGLRSVWKIPQGMKFIPQYERELKC